MCSFRAILLINTLQYKIAKGLYLPILMFASHDPVLNIHIGNYGKDTYRHVFNTYMYIYV